MIDEHIDVDESTGVVNGALSGTNVGSQLRSALAAAAALPLPGAGATRSRFDGLSSVASRDLSLGRLYEGHADALAILAEAGRSAGSEHAYGVWAARGPRQLTAAPTPSGWRLSGAKEFCSGVDVVDRALVTADAPDGYRLFDVDLTSPGVRPVPGSWPAVGMAGSLSLTVEFDAVEVDAAQALGRPGFYTDRIGFWPGAIGVAACWYGGARGLVSTLVAGTAPGPADHVLIELGRAVALLGGMRATLRQAADDIDGGHLEMRYRALEVREVVHRSCLDVLGHVAAAGGARGLAHDPAQSRRAADLYVYLSQHHGGFDAAELGRLARHEGLH